MNADDELCLCFHVTRRKVEQYVRARRPAVASQLSECYGAGTGCGWCRPFLQRLHAQVLAAESPAAAAEGLAADASAEPAAEPLPDPAAYAAARAEYRARNATDRRSE